MKKGELRAAISRGYREMSELTKVKCGGDKCPGVGNRAYRCCDRMHCQMTIDHAYKDWGIRLPTTGHQLPLMGPTGCTALPHLRPWCTLHQCQIQETGSTKDRGWDAKYFRLRNKLTRLEQQLAGCCADIPLCRCGIRGAISCATCRCSLDISDRGLA